MSWVKKALLWVLTAAAIAVTFLFGRRKRDAALHDERAATDEHRRVTRDLAAEAKRLEAAAEDLKHRPTSGALTEAEADAKLKASGRFR